jgi:hypothetical protein
MNAITTLCDKYSGDYLDHMEKSTQIGSIITCSLFITIGVVLLVLFYLGLIPFQYFVATLAIGLIIIGIVGLVAIRNYSNNRKAEAREFTGARATAMLCPDFFTRDSSNVCINTYSSPQYTYKIVDSSNNVDLNLYLNKPITSACDQLRLDAYRNSIYIPESNTFPWTYLQSRCDSI